MPTADKHFAVFIRYRGSKRLQPKKRKMGVAVTLALKPAARRVDPLLYAASRR